jgi:hypothetical protein
MLTPMRLPYISALLIACFAFTLLAGCRKDTSEADTYSAIAASAGIGVAFGSSPDVVHAKLGPPTQTVERGKTADPPNAADPAQPVQAARMVQDFYVAVPPGIKPPEMPNPDPSQLALTYFDNKLITVVNSYRPEVPGALTPPIVAQPVAGVQLGMKRSEIEAVLGKPNYGTLRDGWQFVGEDGGAVVVQPVYTKIESSGEVLASTISIEYKEAGSSMGKGEFFDKRKQRKDAVKDLTAK